MPKLKPQDMAGFNPDKLDVEWEDSDFESYDGEMPPSGVRLLGYIKKMWWTFTSEDVPMIKALFIADGNTGKTEQYNGLPIWDQITFKESAAFRYGPFLQMAGFTLHDIFNKTYVAEDDDNLGAPIEKIARVVPGEDMAAEIITKREKYNGEWRVNVGKYVLGEADDDDDDDDEPSPPPRRAAKSASKPSPKSRRKPEPEPDDDDDDDDDDADDADDDDDEPPAKPDRDGVARKPAAKAASKPAARGRTTRSAKTRARADDEPF